MGISGKVWRKLAMVVAVPGVVIGTVAGFGAPAMANTAQPHVVSGIEHFHGLYRGVSPYIPIYADGVVSDHGYLNLTAGNPGHIIQLRRGDLYVGYHNSYSHYHVSQYSCIATFSDTVSYDIHGGTGAYYYAAGWGTAHIQITAVLERNHNGSCSNTPKPGTVFTQFDASGPFYPWGL
jgi:hypothetical protein